MFCVEGARTRGELSHSLCKFSSPFDVWSFLIEARDEDLFQLQKPPVRLEPTTCNPVQSRWAVGYSFYVKKTLIHLREAEDSSTKFLPVPNSSKHLEKLRHPVLLSTDCLVVVSISSLAVWLTSAVRSVHLVEFSQKVLHQGGCDQDPRS